MLNVCDDNWKTFFQLLRMKKEGKLPEWFKVNPPRYSKKGKKRVPFVRVEARQWEFINNTISIGKEKKVN